MPDPATIQDHINTVAQAETTLAQALAAQEAANSNVAAATGALATARTNLNTAIDTAVNEAQA